MPTTTSNIDKCHFIVLRDNTIEYALLYRKPIYPIRSPSSDALHQRVDIVKNLRLPMPIVEGFQLCAESKLEQSVGGVVWTLEAVLLQILWEFDHAASALVPAKRSM